MSQVKIEVPKQVAKDLKSVPMRKKAEALTKLVWTEL